MTEAMRPYLDRLQSRALVVGVVGLLATAAGFAMNSEQFYRSYLLAFMLWSGVALGSLSLLMLHHMVGGGWGVAIRRGLEAGTRTLPLVVLLFLPSPSECTASMNGLTRTWWRGTPFSNRSRCT